MIALSCIVAIMAIGLIIHSIDSNHPKFIILIECFIIFVSISIIWNLYTNPIPEPTLIEFKGNKYYIFNTDSAYQLGYSKGLIDCKTK
jgi:hypothetical protein